MTGVASLAEAFPPGEYIRDELVARDWTQEDLAQIMGRPLQMVNEVVNGKRSITTDTAIDLGAALGTGPEVWLNLQTQYQLFQAGERGSSGEEASRRAALSAELPVRDMIKRGWISGSHDVDELEKEALEFIGVESLDDLPSIRAAARRSSPQQNWTPKQLAWLCRVRQVAEAVGIDKTFVNDDATLEHIADLVHLSTTIESIRQLPASLADVGIVLVIETPLPGSKMDGAALWVGEVPVVALSLRYDRIDHLWYTLFHELAHIVHGDAKTAVVLDDETTEREIEMENSANQLAAEWSLPGVVDGNLPRHLSGILDLAEELDVHPGLVVGRLHHLGSIGLDGIPYNRFRNILVKVRHVFRTELSR